MNKIAVGDVKGVKRKPVPWRKAFSTLKKKKKKVLVIPRSFGRQILEGSKW